MRLVEEANLGGDIGERLPAQDAVAGRVEAPSDQADVRRDAVGLGERTGQLRRAGSQLPCEGGHRHRFERVGVEERADLLGEVKATTRGQPRRRVAQTRADALGDECQAGLRFEDVVEAAQRGVECRDPPVEGAVRDDREVHRRADQVFAEHARVEVEHTLLEATASRRSPVVDYVRRKDRDHRWLRAALTAVEVVADRAVVDDEDRPGVVGVRRIRVVREPSVQHLSDPRDGRLPRTDRDPGRR